MTTPLWCMCGIIISFIVSCGPDDTPSKVARIATPEWTSGSGLLLVRRESPSDNLLLWKLRDEQIPSVAVGQQRPWMKFNAVSGEISATYRFELGRKLEQVAFDEWKNANGLVAESGGDNPIPNRLSKLFTLSVDPTQNTYELEHAGKKITTKGNAPFQGIYSPDHDRVAVLSVNGPAATLPGIISGGTLTYKGPFYHELFKLKDGARVGEAIELADSQNAEFVMMVWSADGKQLVYFDQKHRYVWVVDTPTEAPTATVDAPAGETNNTKIDPRPNTTDGKDKK